MNTELFRRVLEVIEAEPQGFAMDSWEGSSPAAECNTTRCLAGWAIHLTTGEPLYRDFPGGGRHPSVVALARQERTSDSFEDLGAALLGLRGQDTQAFFLDEDDALEFIRLAASGDSEAARQYLRDVQAAEDDE